MSIQLWLYRAPADSPPYSDWEQFHAINLGSLHEVKAQLMHALPGLRWELTEGRWWFARSAQESEPSVNLHFGEHQPGAVHFVVVHPVRSVVRQIVEALRLTHCCCPETGEMYDAFASGEDWVALE